MIQHGADAAYFRVTECTIVQCNSVQYGKA